MGCGTSKNTSNTSTTNKNTPQTNPETNQKQNPSQNSAKDTASGGEAGKAGSTAEKAVAHSNTAAASSASTSSGTQSNNTQATTNNNKPSNKQQKNSTMSIPAESTQATPIDNHDSEHEPSVTYYVLTMDSGDEHTVYRNEDGDLYYQDLESMSWQPLPKEMEAAGVLREAEEETDQNDIQFDRFVSNDGTEYFTYLAEDGNRYYINFEKSEWEPFPEELLKNGSFVAADEEDEDEDDEEEYGTYTDAQGHTYTTCYGFEEVKVRYFFDEELNTWVKFPDAWKDTGSSEPVDLRKSLTRQSTVKDMNEDKMKILQLEEQVEELQVALEEAGLGNQGLDSASSVTATRKQLEEQVEERERELSEMESENAELKRKLDDATKEVARLQGKLDSLEAASSQLGKSQNAGLERIQTLENDLRSVKEDLNTANSEAEKSRAKATSLAAELEQAKSALQETEKARSKAEIEAKSVNERVEELNKELEVMRTQGEASFQSVIAEKDAALDSAQKEAQEKDAALSDAKHELDSARETIQARDASIAELQEQLDSTKAELSAKREESQNKAGAVAALMTKVRAVQMEYQKLKPDYDELKALTRTQITEFTPLFTTNEKEVGKVIKNMGKALDMYKAKYRAENLKRKMLYNKIQEMRGNIRVFLRCRGLNDKEISENDTIGVEVIDDSTVRVTNERGDTQDYEFDNVYGPEATQVDVYQDTAPTITSCLDGYNVCIFAYGQTGAGKTYTMMGPKDARGVNFQALEELFNLTTERADEYEYNIYVASLEIYNEKIHDLLDSDDEKTLEVRQGPSGNYVPGLTERLVTSMEEIEDLIAVAEENRTTGETSMNARSSRSHSMLQVRAESRNKISGVKTNGRLTLVDLAGSERQSRSQAQGQRLVEAAAINNSLSNLGTVIASLQSKKDHVPYRNSKLTYLLQDSLGGDSKTLMFLCVSPATANVGETICSLDFGARVRNVVLGPATRHTSMLGKPGKKGKKGKKKAAE